MAFTQKSFIAGAACLDFVNTVGGHRDGTFDDQLTDYGALLDWAAAGALLAPRAAAKLRAKAATGSAGAKTLRRAWALREAVYDVAVAAHAGAEPARKDMEIINSALQRALGRQKLGRHKGVWRLDWAGMDAALDSPLWPVAASAAALLQSPDLARLRECASETCGWLFLDFSKNGSRRWCDMRVCGNRRKARRHRG